MRSSVVKSQTKSGWHVYKIVSCLLVTFSALSAKAAAVIPANCPQDSSDPFSYQARVPSGPYVGRCIDSNVYRSVHVLSEAEAAAFGLAPDADKLYVANFRHLDRFWIASIPVAHAQTLEFQRINLAKGTSIFHTQLRVSFAGNEAIELISQKQDPSARTTLKLVKADGSPQDFIIALFGARDAAHTGQSFRPLNGFGLIKRSVYVNSYAFQSMYDGDQWVIDGKKTSHQYLLKTDANDTRQAIEFAAQYSEQHKMTIMYDVFVRNCVAFTYSILADISGHTAPGDLASAVNSVDPDVGLHVWGLIEKAEPSLKAEFPKGIQK